MSKKRSIFDIDFDVTDDAAPAPAQPKLETKSFRDVQGHPLQNTASQPSRRGPMASAISETAEATAARSEAEAAIRAENDSLAHEFVRLKKLGLITDLIQTSSVHATKLIRDRALSSELELEDLKASIVSIGLSNPIRVEQSENGFELIQGYRRLAAFRELAQETGDARYTRIPAALVPRGEPLEALYQKMVDENLVRKDLSFGEMAQLALSYADDTGIETSDAVTQLFASANKQKRSYIRTFARLLTNLKGTLNHADAIPRSLGISLAKALDADATLADQIVTALSQAPNRSAAEELRVLEAMSSTQPAPKPRSKKVTAKSTLQFQRPEGEGRVVAHDGRVELRLPRDFSAVGKDALQAAVDAFLAELDRDASV